MQEGSPQYTNAGTYTVQVGIKSDNYRAEPVECKLTIKGGTQEVVLTPVTPGAWDEGIQDTITMPLSTVAEGKVVANTVQVTGVGQVNGATVSEEGDIQYGLVDQSDEDYATVDPNTGVVTSETGHARRQNGDDQSDGQGGGRLREPRLSGRRENLFIKITKGEALVKDKQSTPSAMRNTLQTWRVIEREIPATSSRRHCERTSHGKR